MHSSSASTRGSEGSECRGSGMKAKSGPRVPESSSETRNSNRQRNACSLSGRSYIRNAELTNCQSSSIVQVKGVLFGHIASPTTVSVSRTSSTTSTALQRSCVRASVCRSGNPLIWVLSHWRGQSMAWKEFHSQQPLGLLTLKIHPYD